MTDPTMRSYGAWPSPISVEMAVAGGRGLSDPRSDGDDLYFLESRPDEAGRVVLMRQGPDGVATDVTPRDLNVRTRVHEYGGAAYAVKDGIVVFSEFDGNRLMLQPDPGNPPVPLSSEPARYFSDLEIDMRRRRVLAVLEDHSEAGVEARNLVCAVSLHDGSLMEIATGHDFFSDPRLSPDGDRMAWLTWDHPNMPWDGTDLWVAAVADDGRLGEPTQVAGGASESVLHPVWAPDGSLVFASDRNDWWNLYRWQEGASGAAEIAPMQAEVASPPWVFGLSQFDVDVDGTIVVAPSGPTGTRLLVLSPGQSPREVQVQAGELEYVRVGRGVATMIAGSPTYPDRLIKVDVGSGSVSIVREAADLAIDAAYLSVPRRVEFPTSDGHAAFAWYYPPTNPDVQAPPDERPPLVVMSHGGPTSSARTSLSLVRQVFASRGFAVADVDYRGSSGYGRAYREQLDGRWGELDVDDCTNVAAWLAEQGLADPDRLVIRGGSAGGFTTLAALCFRDVFAAGTSFYGVADLEALTRFTHKFESRYLDGLIGPYPEQVERYRQRSPIHHVDGISCPVLVMQGADDLVVPQAQADEIVAALERKDLPRAYLLFAGEGHGFRQAPNQRRALEAELSFYAQVFGLELADDFEPLEVLGLET